ncbi:hypothetical protein KR038_001199 [Drosophila bunnanda]|nr:hypothetical protein KR038_001199 [Drosophila bunnanda]
MSMKKKKTKVPKSQAVVPRFCQRVIDDVVANMRQAFLDDGVGEQALQRMLHMWRSKMMSSKSIDLSPATPPTQDTEMDSDQEPCTSSSVPCVKKEISETLGSANQLDGSLDDSDEEDDENDLEYNNDDNDDDNDSDNDGDFEEETENSEGEHVEVVEEPLNSGDDLTDDEEIEDKFDTENLVACQYDVVSRARNKWKFLFRDGMMKINGKEFVFKRAEGEAVW